jgi:hypothetical protein
MTNDLDNFNLRYFNLGQDDLVGRVDVLANAVRDLLSENASLRRNIDELMARVQQVEWDVTDHTIPEER